VEEDRRVERVQEQSWRAGMYERGELLEVKDMNLEVGLYKGG
jgi:hypothetical protein